MDEHKDTNGTVTGNGVKIDVGRVEEFFRRNGVVAALDEKATEEQLALALREYLEPIRCHNDVWRGYKDGCWREIKPRTLIHYALNMLAPAKRTERRAGDVLRHLGAILNGEPEPDYRTFVIQEPDRTLINCANGVLEVTRTARELLPHALEFNFIKTLAVDFVRDAECPVFTGVMLHTLPDFDDAVLFQLFCGYPFVDDCRFHCCLLMVGFGLTGKSTLLKAIAAVLGVDLVSGIGLHDLCDYRTFALPTLRGKALNIATELDTKELAESSIFKAMVCGEIIPSRAAFKDWAEMTIYCKHVFAANNAPYFAHCTDAELRRVRIISCNHKVRKVDVHLSEKIAVELSGVLNFMLDGFQQLLSMDAMPYGGENSQKLFKRYRDSATPVETFARVRCEFAPELVTAMSALYGGFFHWAEESEGHVRSKQSFHREFQRLFPDVNRSRRRISGELTYVYEGVGFRSDA